MESLDIFFIVLLGIREGKALTGKLRLVFCERGFGGKQNLVDMRAERIYVKSALEV